MLIWVHGLGCLLVVVTFGSSWSHSCWVLCCSGVWTFWGAGGGVVVHVSGTKKEPKPKLLSPDIFWWGGGLPRGVGAKKFGMSLETHGIKLFWRDIPGFCRDIPEAPEKFEKQMFGFNFWPLMWGSSSRHPGHNYWIDCHHRVILFTNLQDTDIVSSRGYHVSMSSHWHVIIALGCFVIVSVFRSVPSESTRLHILTFVVVVVIICLFHSSSPYQNSISMGLHCYLVWFWTLSSE